MNGLTTRYRAVKSRLRGNGNPAPDETGVKDGPNVADAPVPFSTHPDDKSPLGDTDQHSDA